MKKEQTIQKKLFIHYFILIAGIVLVFFGMTLFFMLRLNLENAAKTLRQTVNSIQNEVEMEVDKANSLQKRILFSDQFREVLFSEPEKYGDVVQSLQLYRKLSALSDTVCGPDEYRNFQMNYWNSNGGCAGVGYNAYIYYRTGELENSDEYQRVVEAKGKKVMSAPKQTKWAETPTEVLSMYRLIEKKGSDDKVIIETQMNYENICRIIEENINVISKGKDGYDVLVYNDMGEVIYASENIRENKDDYVELTTHYSDGKVGRGKNARGESQMYAGVHSQDLGWHMWVFEDSQVYMASIKETVAAFLLIGVAVILILWVITYVVTKQFAKPILDIHGKMKRMDLEHLDEIEQADVGENIKELRELNGTFNEMCRQLKESKEKLQAAHENELQSRFLAMQAQMNPHFLYNILSIIKIMGKEAKSTPIVETCTELSMMLRYISSTDRKEVTIGHERKHLENYMKLMKTRFQDRFEYIIDIPEEIEAIPVPRLILQPLAENSMKYATEGRAPWRVMVRGWIEGGEWYLSVRDNGPGIAPDKKRELEDEMRPELVGEHSASLEIGGMGLLNIYSRLVLLYGDRGILKLNNHPDGGLEVIIGGNADEQI